MTIIRFPQEFVWGVATASFQIEGAAREDGRGESIWDRFCRTDGKVLNGDNGDIACDHYHRYKDDVKLMKELGIKAYRLSIAWPRIFPEGKGYLNQKGLDFYKRLVYELKESGIEPYVTLYHWDLPQALQDIGGWENRDMAEYFAQYSGTMFDNLGGMVKNWYTINEPWCCAYLGYGNGLHAPGIADMGRSLGAAHNILLAHAKSVQTYRASKHNNGKIGIVVNISPAYPKTDSAEDLEAAQIFDGYFNRWYLEPALIGSYPEDMLEIFSSTIGKDTIRPGDMEIMKKSPGDMIGINYYSRSVIKHTNENKLLKYDGCDTEGPVTSMGWEIYPNGLYDFLTRLRTTYGNPEVYITENGAAFEDNKVVDGRIDDADRLSYLKQHFAAAHKAMTEGLNLKGYFVWSLMDNFEWNYGYSKRFGIVGVDYDTQVRTPKSSALWYRNVIRSGEVTLG